MNHYTNQDCDARRFHVDAGVGNNLTRIASNIEREEAEPLIEAARKRSGYHCRVYRADRERPLPLKFHGGSRRGDDTTLRVAAYAAWLTAKPGRTAYVFPASKSGARASDRVRDALRGIEFRCAGVVEVPLTDYLPGNPVEEPEVTVATSERLIADAFDPTGALRKAGLLCVQIVGDREAA